MSALIKSINPDNTVAYGGAGGADVQLATWGIDDAKSSTRGNSEGDASTDLRLEDHVVECSGGFSAVIRFGLVAVAVLLSSCG